MSNPLDDQGRKRRLINLIREFSYGKSREEFRSMLFGNGGVTILLDLAGLKEFDHRVQWVFEQMERELYGGKK